MRYTTIIDLREYRKAYANTNVRLLYLHMVLVAGYHVDDRDICKLSLRQLAADVGLTLSAVRHALKVLEGIGMVARQGDAWHVTKFAMPKEMPTRPRAGKLTNGYSEDAWKILNYRPEYVDEKKRFEQMLQQQHKTTLMWRYEMLYRLYQNGDKTTEKYLRANAKEYKNDCLKMQQKR